MKREKIMDVPDEAFANFDWVGCFKPYVKNGGPPVSGSSRITVSRGDGQLSGRRGRSSRSVGPGRNNGVDDGESQSSEDEPGNGPNSQRFSPLLRFACPFHQYNPKWYSPNNS